MDAGAAFADLPGWMLVAIGLLSLVQITVEVIALVVLVRTPIERVVLGKKWPWVLLILLVNLVGAIVFLAAGRKPVPIADPFAAPSGVPVADALYGAPQAARGPEDEKR